MAPAEAVSRTDTTWFWRRPQSSAGALAGRPPPRLARPPLLPALAARSRLIANERLAAGTLPPPFRAISVRRSGDIAAKPRRALGFSVVVMWSPSKGDFRFAAALRARLVEPHA